MLSSEPKKKVRFKIHKESRKEGSLVSVSYTVLMVSPFFPVTEIPLDKKKISRFSVPSGRQPALWFASENSYTKASIGGLEKEKKKGKKNT
jgi:hypothetical protein